MGDNEYRLGYRQAYVEIAEGLLKALFVNEIVPLLRKYADYYGFELVKKRSK